MKTPNTNATGSRRPRVLFVTFGVAGHLNACAGIVRCLGELGCDVSLLVLGVNSLDQQRREALPGVDVRFSLGLGLPDPERMHGIVAGGEPALRRSLQRLYEAAPSQVPELQEIIRAPRPDLVVIDVFPQATAAIVATKREAIPYAFYWPNLMAIAPRSRRPGLAPLDETLGAFLRAESIAWSDAGQSPRSPVLNLVAATHEFVGDDAALDGIELVGFPESAVRGDEPRFDWSRLPPARDVIYVSLGTITYWCASTFRSVFAAAKKLDLAVVASVGNLADALGHVGDHVVVERYVPQREILARSRAFVTHGGFNSVTESLSRGVPMLVAPQAFDTFVMAKYVERSGAGLTIDKSELSEDSLVDKLRALIAPENSYRKRAQWFATNSPPDGSMQAARKIFSAVTALVEA